MKEEDPRVVIRMFRLGVTFLLTLGVTVVAIILAAPFDRGPGEGQRARWETVDRRAPARAVRSSSSRDSSPRVIVLDANGNWRSTESRSRASRAGNGGATWTADEWTPLYSGVEHAEVRAWRPRRMVAQAIRIDTSEPGVEFFATPSNGSRPGETDGLRTSSFLTRYGLQAAINAAPFSPIWGAEGKPQDIKGLGVSGGETVSPPSGYPALLISRDNEAIITGPPFQLDGVHNAVCGFNIILEDGEVRHGGGDVHPRVAVGVSRDGRYVYFLVVDGRQWNHSVGATCPEVAECLKQLGAWDGLNLDGGGTTTMVVSERGRARLVNRPIHNGMSGNERVSGSHLGVRARPLTR